MKVRVLDHLEVSRRIYVVPLVLSGKTDVKICVLVDAAELKEELINRWRIVGKERRLFVGGVVASRRSRW